MYTYTAAGTGLDACLPPWTEDGGYPALFKRLRDPASREKIAAEVRIDSDAWENLYLASRVAGQNSAGRIQIRKTQAADRQITRRSS